jgi:hypothetical protein
MESKPAQTNYKAIGICLAVVNVVALCLWFSVFDKTCKLFNASISLVDVIMMTLSQYSTYARAQLHYFLHDAVWWEKLLAAFCAACAAFIVFGATGYMLLSSYLDVPVNRQWTQGKEMGVITVGSGIMLKDACVKLAACIKSVYTGIGEVVGGLCAILGGLVGACLCIIFLPFGLVGTVLLAAIAFVLFANGFCYGVCWAAKDTFLLSPSHHQRPRKSAPAPAPAPAAT